MLTFGEVKQAQQGQTREQLAKTAQAATLPAMASNPGQVAAASTVTTTPPGNQPIRPPVNDLSPSYGLNNGTVYNKQTNQGYSDPQSFFKDSGVNSFENLQFDTNYTLPARPVSDTYSPSEDPNAQGSNGQFGNTGTLPARPNIDYTSLLNQLQQQAVPTETELAKQQAIDKGTADYNTLINNLEASTSGSGLTLGTLSGQESNLYKKYNTGQQTLTQQLATLQQQRQAKLSATQAALGVIKPTELSMGANLVNPVTGATVAQGQSYVAKQGQQAVFDLIKNYSDAGIFPTDTPEVAAAKASNSPSFQIKHSGQSATINPVTGEIVFYQNKGPGVAGRAGFQEVPIPVQNSTSSGSGISFTLASDGRTVLANGTPVDLTTFRQMTGQTGGNTDFSMVQGNKPTPKVTPAYKSPTGSFIGPTNSKTVSASKTGLDNIGFNSSNQTDAQALTMFQSGETNPTHFPAINAKLQVRARQIAEALGLGKNYNLTSGKAVQDALKKQTDSWAGISSATNAVDLNLQLLQDAMKYVNKSNSPLANEWKQAFDNHIITNDQLVKFNTALQTVRAEYSRIVARGGVPDDADKATAAKLLPSDITAGSLQGALDILKKEGQNVLAGTQSTIDFLKGMGAPTSDTSGTVIMTGPDGKQYSVPTDKVDAFKAAGGTYSPK